jgi:glutamyl-tRNA reductase
VNRYFVIAFTHKSTGLSNLDSLFVEDSDLVKRLQLIKEGFAADGLMYLATCNRVEFIFSMTNQAEKAPVTKLLSIFKPTWDKKKLSWALKHSLTFSGEDAVQHIFEVASSLDSLVVGEREIITQVRSAYEWSHEQKLSDDFIRILIKKTIETAKKVYTDTKIAEKPVSVMSLACRKMQDWRIGFDSRVLMVGAGQTADIMVKYLSKHGFTKFAIFNRTLKHAKELAARYNNVEAYSLKDLDTYSKGFDVLITCARSTKPFITGKTFDKLVAGEKGVKTIVDLGLPMNVEKDILKKKNVRSVTIKDLEGIARVNLKERKAEMKAAQNIIGEAVAEFYTDVKNRKIELAMREVPQRIQEIKEKAISSVFSKEIEGLNPGSREVLEKVVNYLEKKYISIPMQLAKDILMNQDK